MSDFYESLPGQFKIMIYLISGMLIALPILAIPHRFLVRIGKTKYLSPNWLSIWRTPIAWIGYTMYFHGYPYQGFCVVVLAFILDRIDGKVAAAYDEENKKSDAPTTPTGKFWEDLNYLGSTPTGKWLDPMGDKITVPIPMIVFSIMGYMQWYAVVTMLCLEVIGTLIRKPFLPLWPFRLIESYVRGEGASWAGKVKVIAQYVCLFLGMIIHQKWVEVDSEITLTTLVTINLMAIISILSRLKTHAALDEVADKATSAFNHKE
ncbi:CDP-alcohol phosphatidyltransferase family protein [Candidatus Peregrinibacteria bacterium]|nr:CDP-alcohol phosphatidyltransferase family protein [Candidatus Peregrinibacteria bacterium]